MNKINRRDDIVYNESGRVVLSAPLHRYLLLTNLAILTTGPVRERYARLLEEHLQRHPHLRPWCSS